MGVGGASEFDRWSVYADSGGGGLSSAKKSEGELRREVATCFNGGAILRGGILSSISGSTKNEAAVLLGEIHPSALRPRRKH